MELNVEKGVKGNDPGRKKPLIAGQSSDHLAFFDKGDGLRGPVCMFKIPFQLKIRMSRLIGQLHWQDYKSEKSYPHTNTHVKDSGHAVTQLDPFWCYRICALL